MKETSIIGAYETKHGDHKKLGLRDLIAEAGNGAIADAGIDRADIEAVYVGNYAGTGFNGQNTMGSLVATVLGLGDKPAMRLEGACASGGLAVRQAMLAVASGQHETVMAFGVEKMNGLDPDKTMKIVAEGQDQDLEGGYCISGPSGFAMNAVRHMHEFGTTREQMAMVAEKNFYHGSLNPYAHKQRIIKLDRIIKAPQVSYPFGIHDVSLVTDAAAAVIITTRERAKALVKKPVRILGSGHGGDYFTVAMKGDSVSFPASVKAANEAFNMAGIQRTEIDVLECHDCFTVTEIINIEDLGFVEKGKGGPFTAEGHTRLGGKLPVNTSGGLKAKGHPIGCTGVGQIVEMTFQLRDQAEGRQVANAKHAMTHVLGGPGAVSAVHILGRED
ncbi:MAG: thiolase domain-containing protein [Leptospiraceae bacterium]|nr:thiolase domain-containing protein [Leptospiraceae bacterium]